MSDKDKQIICVSAEEIMRPLIPEQLETIENCKKAAIVFDEDNPGITPDEFRHFRRRAERIREAHENNKVFKTMSPLGTI